MIEAIKDGSGTDSRPRRLKGSRLRRAGREVSHDNGVLLGNGGDVLLGHGDGWRRKKMTWGAEEN